MSEMLYLQTERNIKITSPVVTLGLSLIHI